MGTPIEAFVLASLLMGLGIGADVAIATLTQAKQLSSRRSVFTWIAGVTLTHTMFPMLGYLAAYFSVQQVPVLTPIVGIIAFIFVGYYLLSEYRSNSEHAPSIDPKLLSAALIITVSWDALWSGPAKSAQVIDWAQWMVWLSFVIVGLVVALLAVASLHLGRKAVLYAPTHFSHQFGLWLQYSVISYFAVLALLRYTFVWDTPWWAIWALCAIINALLLALRKVGQAGTPKCA